MKTLLALLLLASSVSAAPRCYQRQSFYGYPYGGAVVINHYQPRPVYVQPPPRPLTQAEREQLQGVYRGTNNATPTYGGGPQTIFNPFVNQNKK